MLDRNRQTRVIAGLQTRFAGAPRPVRGLAGFTLIELLVVISIIALLASMLLPSLMRAKDLCKGATCFSHLRGIGLGTHYYVDENNQFFPPSQMTAQKLDAWEYVILGDVGGNTSTGRTDTGYFNGFYNGLYRCPADPRTIAKKFSYGLNDYFEVNPTDFTYEGSPGTWHNVGQVPHQAETILFGELKDGSMPDHFMPQDWVNDPNLPTKEVDTLRHPAGSNYAFVDGHAETHRLESLYNWNPPTSRLDNFNPSTAK